MGAEHFLQKYVDELIKPDPCCPLCHREFDTEQDIKELMLEVCSQNVFPILAVANKLEQDFQISKHHLISQRENYIMVYTIVLDNKPSSLSHQ